MQWVRHGWGIAQLQLEGGFLPGPEFQLIVRRGLGAGELGVDGLGMPLYDIVVNPILDERRGIRGPKQPPAVRLVLCEQQGWGASAHQPAPSQRLVHGLNHGIMRCPLASTQHRPCAVMVPGPGIAKPERGQDMQAGCVGAAVDRHDTHEDMIDRGLGVFNDNIEIALVSENAGVE